MAFFILPVEILQKFDIMYLVKIFEVLETAMKFVIIAAVAYLLGSFCASIPLSKRFFGEDVRNMGSGNAGATNVARCFGIRAGLITLACDMLKTVAAMLLGFSMAGEGGMALAGAFCILGHCFPLYFDFRGGKGVSAGAALALMQGAWVFVSVMAVFAIVAFSGKKVSLASICAAVSLPIASAIFTKSTQMLIMSLFSAALVVIMHRANIKRLINGTEPDFKPGKSM